MDPIQQTYDQHLKEMFDQTTDLPITSKEFADATKNLHAFSAIRAMMPELEPDPDPVPTTVWGRVKAGASTVYESETTRVFLKAGGAFSGVALVVWATIHKDHIMERQALAQANQRNS